MISRREEYTKRFGSLRTFLQDLVGVEGKANSNSFPFWMRDWYDNMSVGEVAEHYLVCLKQIDIRKTRACFNTRLLWVPTYLGISLRTIERFVESEWARFNDIDFEGGTT